MKPKYKKQQEEIERRMRHNGKHQYHVGTKRHHDKQQDYLKAFLVHHSRAVANDVIDSINKSIPTKTKNTKTRKSE